VNHELTHVCLFSGIGGFSLAAEACGLRTVVFCERDADRQRDLAHHWPGVPIVGDVNDVDAIERASVADAEERENQLGESGDVASSQRCWRRGDSAIGDVRQPPFLLTAGVPCQPASSAGKRLGAGDDRWLWPQTLRVVERLRPRWCVFENPLGLASLALPAAIPGVDLEGLRGRAGRTVCEIIRGLDLLGYDLPRDGDGVPWIPVVPAVAIGAFHGRDRLFLIARRRDVDNTNGPRFGQGHAALEGRPPEQLDRASGGATLAHLDDAGLEGQLHTGSNDSERRQEPSRLSSNAGGDAQRDSAREAGGTVDDGHGGRREQREPGQRGVQELGARRELPDWSTAHLERGADGITRATQPGLCLLAHGIPRRVAKLRGFGNAVVPQVAAQIIAALAQSEGVR